MNLPMTLLAIGFTLLGMLAMILSVLAFLAYLTGHYSNKLMAGLPWQTWFTFEDALALGVPEFYCRGLLIAFYDIGRVEVRKRMDLTGEQEIRAAIGFDTETVHFYEFKLVKKGRPRRQPKDKPNLAWAPSGVPA